jgi:hypothetical protein
MSDDLVRRLACPYPKDEDVEEVTLPVWVILLTTEAADRIEELKGQLKTVLDRETSILRYYDAKLDAAEAKLAKAVETASGPSAWLDDWAIHVGRCRGGARCSCGLSLAQHEARTTLAELKGEQP